MAGLVPAIHVFARNKGVDARHTRAFTPVFDGLWPGMTLVCDNYSTNLIRSLRVTVTFSVNAAGPPAARW
jgi:hypothetical protein